MNTKDIDITQEILKLIKENPSITDKQLGEKLGLSESAIRKRRKKHGIPSSIERKVQYPVQPNGFTVKSVSTLTKYDGESDEEGAPILQWVKSVANKDEQLEWLKIVSKEVSRDIVPLPRIERNLVNSQTDSMVIYPITDVHMGLRSDKEETGTDNYLEKSQSILESNMIELVQATQPTELCTIINLGDFFHVDGIYPKTTRSGHMLDISSSWHKMFYCGFLSFKKMIELALQKHEKVHVISTIGNHDDVSSTALMVALHALFSENERVTVELPLKQFMYFCFGSTLIGINHGTVKPNQLPLIMAIDEKEAWGMTDNHIWYCGHTHQKTVHEFPGCTVEGFRAITNRDAWTHGKGYRSEREMNSIRIHIEKGEINRITQKIY